MQIDQILVTNMAVFCYLIVDKDSKEAVLIDPAGDFDKIEERIKANEANIKYIINTHGHWDHVSGNDYMRETTEAKLLIHSRDLEKLEGQDVSDNTPFTKIDEEPDHAVYLIEENDVIKIGKIEIHVVHTPGHSAGAVCLYCNGHLFTGDTMFTEGYGRTDLPGGSEIELVTSIRDKILTFPDETVILPGHHYGVSPTSTVLEQKKFYGLT